MFLEAVGDIGWWRAFLDPGRDERPAIQTNFTFQRQCALSQYRIAGPNKPVLLSIPTLKGSRKGPMRSVRISYAEDWQQLHWRSIEAAYRSAPFFIYYADRFKALYEVEVEYLWDFQSRMFAQLCRSFHVDDQVVLDETPAAYQAVEQYLGGVYPQVFDERLGFTPGLCVLDLLFNLGPETPDHLRDHSSISS